MLASSQGSLATGESEEVRESDASGASATLLSATSAPGITGLAVEGAKLYTANSLFGGAKPLEVYGPVVTLPDVATENATITGNTSGLERDGRP